MERRRRKFDVRNPLLLMFNVLSFVVRTGTDGMHTGVHTQPFHLHRIPRRSWPFTFFGQRLQRTSLIR
jgi:hypothetical protein